MKSEAEDRTMEKKKISIELNLTNEQSIQFFENLQKLEDQWECDYENTTENMSIGDQLISSLNKDMRSTAISENDPLFKFVIENKFILKDFIKNVKETCSPSSGLQMEMLFDYFRWFMKIVRNSENPIKFLDERLHESDCKFDDDSISNIFDDEIEKRGEFKGIYRKADDLHEYIPVDALKNKDVFFSLLKKNDWSIKKLAEMLHISLRTVYRKIERFGLSKAYANFKSSQKS